MNGNYYKFYWFPVPHNVLPPTKFLGTFQLVRLMGVLVPGCGCQRDVGSGTCELVVGTLKCIITGGVIKIKCGLLLQVHARI